MHDDIVGTWTLIRTVPAELPMDGPGSADPWLRQPMDPPTEGWELATGVTLTITPDGRFSEQIDEHAQGGPIDWWELDGTLLDAPAPTHGRVVGEAGEQHLVPDEGIDRVSYEITGVRHGEDTSEVSDRIVRDPDGTLLRLVVVDQGDGGRGRSWYRYERDDFGVTEQAAAREEGTHPAPNTPVPSLDDAVRIALPEERAALIRDQQREALSVDEECGRKLHEERGVPLSGAEQEGLAHRKWLTMSRYRGEVRTGQMSGFSRRLSDGRGLRKPQRRGYRRVVPSGWPRPGEFADFVLEFEVVPALAENALEHDEGARAEIGSLQVMDIRTGELRWVLFTGVAAEAWSPAHRSVEVDHAAIELARELVAMSGEAFSRIPLLPLALPDALSDLEPIPGVEIPGREPTS